MTLDIDSVPCQSCVDGYNTLHDCEAPDYCPCDRGALHMTRSSMDPGTQNCPFCKRIRNLHYEKTAYDSAIRFEPLNPVTPGHMLFLPKYHLGGPEVALLAAAHYARNLRHPHNIITSQGAEATQTVWHRHVHYVPRSEGDGLPLPWTPQQEQQKIEDHPNIRQVGNRTEWWGE